MISLFREKSIVAVFAMAFCTLLVHLHIFYNPVPLVIIPNSGVISVLLQKYAIHFHPIIITTTFVLLTFFQALRLNIILNNARMYAKTGYTIGFAYIFLTGLLPNAYVLNPAVIANSILIFLFASIVKLYNNQNAKGLIFNVGFLTSFLIICYYPAVTLVIFSLMGLGVLRAFRPSEWFIMLLGFAAPFYILFGLLYLNNYNFHNIVLYKLSFFISLRHNDVWGIINLCFLLLLAAISLVVWYPNSNRLVIQMRKNWILILLLFIVTVAGIPFYTKHKMLPEILLLVPAASLLANFFIYPKKKWFINLVIFLGIILIIYNNGLA